MEILEFLENLNIEVLAYWAVWILFYLIPAIVASIREHNNFLAILVLTIFTAWTLIGWVLALVWACTSNTKKNTSREDKN